MARKNWQVSGLQLIPRTCHPLRRPFSRQAALRQDTQSLQVFGVEDLLQLPCLLIPQVSYTRQRSAVSGSLANRKHDCQCFLPQSFSQVPNKKGLSKRPKSECLQNLLVQSQ